MAEESLRPRLEKTILHPLFRLCGRSRRGLCRRWLSLYRLRLQTLQYRRTCPAAPGGVDRQCDGRGHECYCRPGGGPGKCAGGAARPECSLATLSAECRGDIAALAALQQNHNDNEETDQDVNRRDEVNHKIGIVLTF